MQFNKYTHTHTEDLTMTKSIQGRRVERRFEPDEGAKGTPPLPVAVGYYDDSTSPTMCMYARSIKVCGALTSSGLR